MEKKYSIWQTARQQFFVMLGHADDQNRLIWWSISQFRSKVWACLASEVCIYFRSYLLVSRGCKDLFCKLNSKIDATLEVVQWPLQTARISVHMDLQDFAGFSRRGSWIILELSNNFLIYLNSRCKPLPRLCMHCWLRYLPMDYF